MKQRYTSSFVAVLLLVSVGFVAPAARAGGTRVGSAIVWVDKSAGYKREVPENGSSGTSATNRLAPKIVADDNLQDTVLDTALFQRPPPA